MARVIGVFSEWRNGREFRVVVWSDGRETVRPVAPKRERSARQMLAFKQMEADRNA